MTGKMLLHLLILCGIWSQGITRTFADKEMNEASDFLNRQKRVVNRERDEDISIQISSAPHVVIIKQFTRIKCVGNILSLHAVITAASCVEMSPEQYLIISRTTRTNRGPSHNVTDIIRYFGHHPGRREDGIAIVTVGIPFVLSMYSRPIELHTGLLVPGTLGKVSGWGYFFRGDGSSFDRGTKYPTALRTIEVPIISHQHCVDRYRPHIEISEKDICTYHPQKHCGHSDVGAGLVVGGFLVGVFLHSGIVEGQIDPRYPDVFALLQDLEYKNWIRSKLESINLRYPRNHH